MKFLYCVLLLFLAMTAVHSVAIPEDTKSDSIDRTKRIVQVLNCTNPNCKAQCIGRGYRTGQCQIGRCFCSYV